MSFRLPTSQEKKSYVLSQFERIAFRYDLANDVISMGMHRLWKRTATEQVITSSTGNYLDVCCGSGDLTLLLAGKLQAGATVTGVDFSGNMLAVARQRQEKARQKSAIRASISWQQADAQDLPFAANTFDGAIISFGLRNLTDFSRGLQEMARVLKLGGKLVNLDVGHPTLPVYSQLYNFYFGNVVPWLGELIQNDRQAYTYLPESAKAFPKPQAIGELFRQAGLQNIQIHNVAGGAVSMQVGIKA